MEAATRIKAHNKRLCINRDGAVASTNPEHYKNASRALLP